MNLIRFASSATLFHKKQSNKKLVLIIGAAVAVIAIAILIVLLATQPSDATELSESAPSRVEPTYIITLPPETEPAQVPYLADLNNYAAVIYALDETALSSVAPKEYVEYEQTLRETDPVAFAVREIETLQPTLEKAVGKNPTASCTVISQRKIPAESLLRIAESAAVFYVAVEDMTQGYFVDFSVKLTGSDNSIECPTVTCAVLEIGDHWYCAVVKDNETFPP